MKSVGILYCAFSPTDGAIFLPVSSTCAAGSLIRLHKYQYCSFKGCRKQNKEFGHRSRANSRGLSSTSRVDPDSVNPRLPLQTLTMCSHATRGRLSVFCLHKNKLFFYNFYQKLENLASDSDWSSFILNRF